MRIIAQRYGISMYLWLKVGAKRGRSSLLFRRKQGKTGQNRRSGVFAALERGAGRGRKERRTATRVVLDFPPHFRLGRKRSARRASYRRPAFPLSRAKQERILLIGDRVRRQNGAGHARRRNKKDAPGRIAAFGFAGIHSAGPESSRPNAAATMTNLATFSPRLGVRCGGRGSRNLGAAPGTACRRAATA